MTTETKAAYTSLGFCICGHSRANHAWDDYDFTEALGKCLASGCGCEVFSASDIESRERIRQAAPEMLEALEAFIADAYVDDTLCGWCGYRAEIGHGRIHNDVCRVGKAEAAMQKARGKQ